MDWKNIETIPDALKDGRSVLLLRVPPHAERFAFVGFWHDEQGWLERSCRTARVPVMYCEIVLPLLENDS